MEFEWDEANVRHIARHAATPEEAEQVLLNDPLVVAVQLRQGEQRVLCLGEPDAGRLLTVVFTKRTGKIRIVTAHPMNRKQRAAYEEQ
ncbi:MAG: BrnT family toxin [Bryobacteraceae bacterium]|jgi:uncharacterized DUF497 family protein